MSEFKITLKTDLDDSLAKEKLNKLINDNKDKKVKLTADVSDVSKNLTAVLTVLKEINSMSKSLNLGGAINKNSSTSKALSEFKALSNQYNALQKQLSKETNVKSIGVLKNQLNEVGNTINKVKLQLTSAEQAMAKAFTTTSTQKLEASLSKTFSNISSQAKTLGTQIQSAFNNPNMNMGQLNSLQTRFQGLQNLIKNFDMSKMSGESLNNLATKLAQIDTKMKLLNTTANQTKLENKFNIDCTKTISQLEQLRSKYSALGKSTSGIDSLITKTKELQSSMGSVKFGTLQNQLNNVNKEVVKMKSSMSALGSVRTTFGQIVQSFSVLAPGFLIGTSLISGIRSLKTEILDLDKAMTNLKKVANDSDVNTVEKLRGISDNAVAIAKEVAGSVSGVVESMAEASKMGIKGGMEAVQEVAKYSQIFANIGDMDISTSTKGIATILNAFNVNPLKEYTVEVNGAKKSTTELANAMDILNHADNNYSIGVDGIIEAMQNGGSTMAAYGLGIKESVALITSANEAIQDPSRVGNGIKSIGNNLAGLTTSAKTGEIKLNKTAVALENIAKIDIFTDKSQNTVKDMNVLLDEINGKWKNLSDTERKALANAIAGKQQSTVFNSLMNNYDTYTKMMKEFSNGDQFNSALTENQKYIDSIQGRMAALKATWVGISTTVFNSEMIKGGVSALDGFSKGIESVINTIDKLNMGVPAAIASIGLLKVAFSSFRYAESFSAGISLIAMKIASIPSAIMGIPASLTALTGISVTMMGLVGAIAAVSVAYIGLRKLQSYVDEQNTKATRKWNELNSSIKEHQKTIDDTSKKEVNLNNTFSQYEKLAKITNKTKEEQEEYNKVLKQLAKINPDLVTYDENGSPIKARVGEVQDLIREYQKAQREQQKLLNRDLKDKADTSFDKYKEQVDERNKLQKKLAEEKQRLLYNTNETTGISTSKLKDNWLTELLAGNTESTKATQEYFKNLEEYKKKEKEYLDKLTEQRESVSKDQSNWLGNLFSGNDELENAGKKRKQALQNALELDYSEFDKDSMESLGNKMNDWFSTAEYKDLGKFNKNISEVDKLNKAWKDGDISSKAYKTSVDGIAKTLSDLTGGKITVKEFAKMLKLPEFDVESANKTFSDIEDAQNTLNSKLAEMGVEQNSKQRLKLAYDVIQDEKVPQEIKDKIAEFASDGSITNEELKIILDLVADIKDEDLNDTLNEKIDELSEVKKVTQKIAIKYAMEVDGGGDFNQYLEELIGNADVAKDIQISMDTGNLELLKKELNELPEEKRVGIVLAAINSGKYTPDQLQDFLQLLPEQKQVDIITTLQKSGDMTPEQIKELIEGLPPSVQKQIKVTTTGASESKKQLDGVDNSSGNKQKQVRISQSGGQETISTEKEVDKNSNPITKKVTVNETGGKPTLNIIQSIANWVKNRTQTITTIYKTSGRVFGGGSNGGHFTQSKSGFSNVSDTPQGAVSPMSTGFSNVSDTPTSSPVSSPSVPTKVSAKSIGSFGTVATSPALATKITSSYKKILEMVKYGVGIFQELENRISRTANQLDLLSIKMENAVGTKKISYLKTQNKLYENQAKLHKTLFNSLNKERLAIKGSLKKQGFTFNDQGSLTSYEEQMTKLEKAYDSAKKKEDAYSGKSESTKKKLAKATEAANKKLENAKKLTEEYMDLMNSKIPQVEQEWYELQNAIKANNDEIEKLKLEDKLSPFVNDADEATMKMNRLSSLLDRLQSKADKSTGNERIKYLNEEIKLTTDLSKQNDILLASIRSQRKTSRGKLDDYGFKFDSKSGEMTNYDDMMDKYKNSADYEKIKQWADDYIKLGDSMQDAYTNSAELKDQLNELANAVKTAKMETALEPFNNKLEATTSKIKDIQNELDILAIKYENAYGTEKLDILKQQIALNEQLKAAKQEELTALQGKESTLQTDLSGYGFKFDESGNATNMDEALKLLEGTGSYEYVQSVIEQWKAVHEDEIPGAVKSIEEYDAAVKSAYKEQLNTTKEVEDKIKAMYEKQLEDKKNAIQKETDLVKAEMEKQKKAYQDMRAEADYDNEYEEKTSNVSDLQKQLETAKKDNSLGNKKKIADLEKQLADAQKDLDKFVQDKVDQDIMDSYDETAESTEEANNKKLEDLEAEWSDSKIAEMVAQSLETGLFEGIDGCVTNLEDAMVSFAETSGETFGVMGQLVKDELIANLGIALDTLKNYSGIMDTLGVGNKNTLSNMNFDTKDLLGGTGLDTKNLLSGLGLDINDIIGSLDVGKSDIIDAKALDELSSELTLGGGSPKTVNTGDIKINVTSQPGMNEDELAKKIQSAVGDALKGTVEGL